MTIANVGHLHQIRGLVQDGVHQPWAWDQIIFLNRLDLYLKSPDSGERQYKPRT